MFQEFMEFDTTIRESQKSSLEALFVAHRKQFAPNRIVQLLQVQLLDDLLSPS